MLLRDGENLRVGVGFCVDSAWLETRCSFGVQLAENERMLINYVTMMSRELTKDSFFISLSHSSYGS